MKLHLVSCLGSVLSPQLMGNPLSMRRRLQALAASRATRVPPVRRVSQVGGHSRRCLWVDTSKKSVFRLDVSDHYK